jgi:molecular chaperone Hsp33
MENKEINPEELKKQFLLRDRLINIISKDGKLRISFIVNSHTAKEAQRRHILDYVAATYMAQLLAGTSMLSSFLKGEERVSVEITSKKYIKKMYTEATQVGEIRGYCIPNEKMEVENIKSLSDILSDGFLSVTRILYNNNEPTKGIINLIEGDIAVNLASYFNKSEQIPSMMILDSKTNDDGEILYSGGILIQAMPGVDATISVAKLYEFIKAQTKIVDLIENELTLQEIIDTYIPFEYDVIKSRQIDYFCRCTKDRFIEHLKNLDLKELKDMKSQGQNELICHYCNNHYYLENEDFDKLITEKQAKLN